MEAFTNLLTQKVLTTFLTLLAGAVATQLIELLLPEGWRIHLLLRKKRLSKWLKNPPYVIGITSRLNLRMPSTLDTVRETVLRAIGGKPATETVTEIHFNEAIAGAQLGTKIQFGYEEESKTGGLEVDSLNVTVEAPVRYRDLRHRIEDLRGLLEETERNIIRDLNVFPTKRVLYVEVDRLHEFSEWLENLHAQQITGKIRGIDVEFAYYEKRLTIENTINSATINWFKDILTHVG